MNVPKGEFVQKLLPHNAEPALVNFVLRIWRRKTSRSCRAMRSTSPAVRNHEAVLRASSPAPSKMRFAEAGLQPPAVSELIRTMTHKPKMIEGVISFLVKQGTLIRLADGIYVHPTVIASARDAIAKMLGRDDRRRPVQGVLPDCRGRSRSRCSSSSTEGVTQGGRGMRRQVL